jgi:hypothetical protein
VEIHHRRFFPVALSRHLDQNITKRWKGTRVVVGEATSAMRMVVGVWPSHVFFIVPDDITKHGGKFMGYCAVNIAKEDRVY